MMDAITQWVTQIIVFLLVAAIIDLLIPKNAMKKYIKLVIGIILMLIFLRPIFFLFSIDIQNDLESNLNKLFQEDKDDESIEYLTEFQKREIQASTDAYILEQMSTQLVSLAQEQLLEAFHAEIVDIQFQFLTEDEITYDDLEEIIVFLRPGNDQEHVVTMIDEVIILGDDPIEKPYEDDGIKDLLQNLWELEDIKLSIKWEGGLS